MSVAHRIEIRPKGADAISGRNLDHFRGLFSNVEKVEVVRVLTVSKDLSDEALDKIAKAVSNPVIEDASLDFTPIRDFDWVLEVGFLPGVTDNVAHTALELIEDLLKCKFNENEAVYSSSIYFIKGDLSDSQIRTITESITNTLIQRIHIKTKNEYENDGGMDLIQPKVELKKESNTNEINLEIDDEELEILGKKGIKNPDGSYRGPLALSLIELKTIRDYFRKEGRTPTDIEIESIAQTWSEHCKHKIFASKIDEVEKGLYKSFIQKATNDIRAAKGEDDFCVSVFKDNSGAIKFNDKYLVTDKAETHNSPSALDPFGGAITGIVGVNRDALGFGMGAKPIANRYGFCFGDPRDDEKLYRGKNKTNPMLHPHRIAQGIIKGVETGGNESGIPGPQGFVFYNERYKGKPLVFAGTVGIIPCEVNGKSSADKQARVGDYVVMIGGRVGQDGIHGATFSSESLDDGSPSTAVQIGDPITQKRLSDAILVDARDAGLYSSITDNGAGGLSCSVAEMAKECGGCDVDLEKVPLKYPNLEPWKTWISESQERMTFSVPKDKWDDFKKIMDKHGVEATIIGTFNDSGRCVVKYENEKIMDMDMDFLHDGVPLIPLESEYTKPDVTEPSLETPSDMSQVLVDMVGRLNVSSFAGISSVFDHEVKGLAIIKPLQGKGRVNGTATVYKPDYEDWKGIVMSQGINPLYSDIDTYHMAACAIDTSIRNAVSVGGNVDYMALMDNFCWCSSYEKERLGQLKAAVKACYDVAVDFGTPYISGKDSMFNDFKGFDSDNNPIKISVPPTLLVSSLSVIGEVRHCITLDAKVSGDLVYVIGITKNELGGSEYYYSQGETGANVPKVDTKSALKLYRTFYSAVQKELMASAISVGIGGLGVAFAKTAIAGGLGMNVDLQYVAVENVEAVDKLLFSESQSRFVVTVNPELKDQFEEEFKEHTLRLVGQVNDSNKMTMADLEGNKIVDVDIEELEKSYNSSNKYY